MIRNTRLRLSWFPPSFQRDGIRENFRVSFTGEDIGSNLSLIEKVRADFGLVLPGQDEVDQVADGTIDVGDYFPLVEQGIQQSRLQRWHVERDSVVLGFFSYNKLQMFRDLDNGVWPDETSITDNPIIGALFGDGFREPPSALPRDAHLDEHFRPQDMYHVVDADSSQSLAIHDANSGRNLVIQGPPGTGKSQTITNIIADAVARDKRVLFVAEKMAALEVVKRRLDSIGLGQACLELHSHKTNKREILNDLDRTLKSADWFRDGSTSGFDELGRVRGQLNDYDNAVNALVGNSGMTPHDTFGELLTLTEDGKRNPIDWTKITTIGDWTADDFRRKREVVRDLQLRLQSTGVPSQHVFYGSRLHTLLPAAQVALRDKLEDALGSLATLWDTSGTLADAMGLGHPEKVVYANDLLFAAIRSMNAPDTSGLDLSASQWASNEEQIREIMVTGLHWHWMSQRSIEAATSSLEMLSNAACRLGDALCLSHPADGSAVDDLVEAAIYSVEAPDIGSLNLAAPGWESNPDQVRELLSQGLNWQRMRSEYDGLLLPQAWETDFRQTREALDIDGRKFFGRLFSSRYKQAKRQMTSILRVDLPKGVDRQIALIDAVGAEQRLRAEINGNYTDAVSALGREWDGHNTNWDAIAPAVHWWLDLLAAATEGRIRLGAVSLLKGLKVWAKAKVPPTGLQTIDLLTLIDDARRAATAHETSGKELEAVLAADNGVRFDAQYAWAKLPFSHQRRLVTEWACPAFIETPDHTWFEIGQDTNRIGGLSPAEVVKEIDRLGDHVGSIMGSRWHGHNTDWAVVAPAVKWWMSLLSDSTSESSRLSPVAVDMLREMQERTGIVRWQMDNGQSAVDDLSNALNSHQTCVAALQSALDMDNRLRFGDNAGLSALLFQEQQTVLSDWVGRVAEIQDIIGFNNGADALLEERLRPVAVVSEQHLDASEWLTTWFERAWYESIIEAALAERAAIRGFDGQLHEGRIDRFQVLDRQSLDYNRARVTEAHLKGPSRVNDLPDRLPRLSADEGEESETAQVRRRLEQLRILQREIQKRSRHKPIRRLITEAGDIVQDLKPVFMMSPLSIANYLEPAVVKFDLIVFDEASQVRPADALGALLRGEKAVVVGDSRQLPPTSFFERVSHGDDDSDDSVTSDIESILGLFSSKGAPSRELRWHYRSRHESLIAVSNREFYENNLVVFPSPDAGRESAGLRFHHLPEAVFDRGRSATNRQEAEVVARAVMEHAVRNTSLSLGVAAFSTGQAQAIQDRLEMLRRQDDSGEEFFADHPEEPFFVKNLENVQGDERDVIFISIGYGRDANGQLTMNFGPLNREGGERRLNVLITRAKQQCHVFTNLHSDDIDLDKTRAMGVRALKAFLAYAETGVMPEDLPYESAFAVDSPFQRAVANRLRERGYEVHDEVATAGKFIDIGIVDPQRPGRYIIGIECDGASYHSARSARDRDRLREEVLRGLGWKLHRIWSTDWFRNPERELGRAVEAIELAKA